MQITGYDYVIISNVSPNIAVKKFNQEIKSLWGDNIKVHFLEELIDESCFITYIKDNKMEDFFDENAYSINLDGEGPFSLIVNKYKNILMDVSMELICLDDKSLSFEDKDYSFYKILLNNSFEYTLVLPDSPKNEFCSQVIEIIENILINHELS